MQAGLTSLQAFLLILPKQDNPMAEANDCYQINTSNGPPDPLGHCGVLGKSFGGHACENNPKDCLIANPMIMKNTSSMVETRETKI